LTRTENSLQHLELELYGDFNQYKSPLVYILEGFLYLENPVIHTFHVID
jgi:hypothetical protein